MINEKIFLRVPLKFEDICKIYIPSVREVIEEDDFDLFKTLLCITKEEIEDAYTEQKQDVNTAPTPFQYLFQYGFKDEVQMGLLKKAFWFFIHEDINLLPDQSIILIGDIENEITKVKKVEELRFLTEENYFDFQNKVRESLGIKKTEAPDPNMHPKIRAMKAKARYRDKIKAQKGGVGIDFITSLSALCCMGIGITPLNIGEISYASVGPLLTMCQEKDKYETDIRSLQAGAKKKDVRPKYWIKNFEE